MRTAVVAIAIAALPVVPALAATANSSDYQAGMVVPVASIYDNAPRLKDIRARMVAREPVTTAELKMLADVGDGLAAYRLAERIIEAKNPELNAMAARYFAIAVDDGRAYAVAPLVEILADRSTVLPAVSRFHIENTLKRQAAAGNMEAAVALARLYLQGYPFGARPEEARNLMKQAVDAQSLAPGLALQMAVMMAASAPLSNEDADIVRRFLARAAQSPDLGTRIAAENLLEAISASEAEEGEDEHG